jgi:hypothetical protein
MLCQREKNGTFLCHPNQILLAWGVFWQALLEPYTRGVIIHALTMVLKMFVVKCPYAITAAARLNPCTHTQENTGTWPSGQRGVLAS